MNKPIKPPGNWTEGEDSFLRRATQQGMEPEVIAQRLNRLIKSVLVRQAILRLGQ